jgi:hypothetical protein
MGKASRRTRERTGKMPPAKSPALSKVLFADVPAGATSPSGRREKKAEDEVALPQEFPGWQTHDEAWDFFRTVGWTQTRLVPDYASQEFTEQLRIKMKQPQLQFEDRTSVLPLGPNASHRALPQQLTAMMLECEAHPLKVLTVMRNAHNTPAFLGGLWCWFVSEHGGVEGALKHLASVGTATAGLIVVRAEGFNVIPTHVLQGGLRLGAGLAAALLTENPLEFLCCVCHKPFLVEDEHGGQGLLTAFGGECGHPYHTHCLVDHFQRAGHRCHVCEGPLPPRLVPKRAQYEVVEAAAEAQEMLNQISL